MNQNSEGRPTNSSSRTRRAGVLLGITAVFCVAMLIAVNSDFRNAATAAPNESAVGKNSAVTFDTDGALRRPQNYREWMFIGAPVTPNDMNGGKAAFPEFHNVYLDPGSFAGQLRMWEAAPAGDSWDTDRSRESRPTKEHTVQCQQEPQQQSPPAR